MKECRRILRRGNRLLSALEIRLVLVVKNAEKAWLEPFQDVFRNMLQDELRI
jgi:hypothetical protein